MKSSLFYWLYYLGITKRGNNNREGKCAENGTNKQGT
jgi:hypothetical protein